MTAPQDRASEDAEEASARSFIADVVAAMGTIAREHKATGAWSGSIVCPRCGGGLQWVKAKVNGHVHAACATKECIRWMQ